MGEPVRDYAAPLMGELLQAALEGEHLKVAYDSIGSGVTERVIFPYGLYASQGYWYCACFDHKRGKNVPMRADRSLWAERVKDFEPPPELSVQEWMSAARRGAMGGERLRLRARVTERGRKSFELTSLFGSIKLEEEGGIVEAEIPPSEIDYYASRLLSVGTDVFVSPRRSWSRPSKTRPGRSSASTGPESPNAMTQRGSEVASGRRPCRQEQESLVTRS